jgi:hypothetical protein
MQGLALDAEGNATADIYGFNFSDETDARGYFRLVDTCVIALRFDGVLELSLSDLHMRPNILSELRIEEWSGLLKATFADTAYGFHGHIVCRRLRVLSVERVAEKKKNSARD